MTQRLFVLVVGLLRGAVWAVLLSASFSAFIFATLLPTLAGFRWGWYDVREFAAVLVPMGMVMATLAVGLGLYQKPVTQYRALLTLCLSSVLACLFCWWFYLGFAQYLIAMAAAIGGCVWDKVRQLRAAKTC